MGKKAQQRRYVSSRKIGEYRVDIEYPKAFVIVNGLPRMTTVMTYICIGLSAFSILITLSIHNFGITSPIPRSSIIISLVAGPAILICFGIFLQYIFMRKEAKIKLLENSDAEIDRAMGFITRHYRFGQVFKSAVLQSDSELTNAINSIIPRFRLEDYKGKTIYDVASDHYTKLRDSK